MSEKLEDLVSDLMVELRRRIDELERRVKSLELTLGRAPKPIEKTARPKRHGGRK